MMIRSKLYYLIPVLCLECLCLDATTYHVPSSSGGTVSRNTSLNQNSLTFDTTGPQGNQVQRQYNYSSGTGSIQLSEGTYTTPTGETYTLTSPKAYDMTYDNGQNGSQSSHLFTWNLPDGEPITTEYMRDDTGYYHTITGPNNSATVYYSQGIPNYDGYYGGTFTLSGNEDNYTAYITVPYEGSGSYEVIGPDQTKTGTYEASSGTFQVPSTIYLPNGNTLETNGSTVTRESSVYDDPGTAGFTSTYTWD